MHFLQNQLGGGDLSFSPNVKKYNDGPLMDWLLLLIITICISADNTQGIPVSLEVTSKVCKYCVSFNYMY